MRLSSAFCAVLIAAWGLGASAQTVVNGVLTNSSPIYTRIVAMSVGGQCSVSSLGTAVKYASYSINHAGGVLDITEDSSDFDAYLSLYSGSFDPSQPCLNAVASHDDLNGTQNTNSRISATLPAGAYVAVVATFYNNDSGAYTFTSNGALSQAVATAPTPVPVVGIPALIFGALGVFGAAGFISRRRKSL